METHELLNRAGIYLRVYDAGRYYTTCPQCSSKRQTRHQKLKCLGVTIKDDKVFWGCNHCGWTGPETGAGNSGKRNPWPHYDYGDHLRKVRRPAGGFFWQHKNGGGTWESGTEGEDTASLLYRIDEVREAIAEGEAILVVEGEKDVNTCWSLGFAATCNAHGASENGKAPKWTSAHSAQLAGADIVVMGDNDDAGRAHVQAVCECSFGVAASVRTIDLAEEWPACPPGGDVSDWYTKGGGSAALLEELIGEARHYGPGTAGTAGTPHHPKGGSRVTPTSMAELQGEVFMPLKWIVPRYLPEGVTILGGKPKVGKSWLMLATALAVARADLVLCEHCDQRSVLYCALEDTPRRMKDRTEKLIGTSETWPDNMWAVYELPNLDNGLIDTLRSHIEALSPGLVIIDTLGRVTGLKGKNETPYQHEYRTMTALHDLGRKTGSSIIVVHHARKAHSDDMVDAISGTLALAGAADTVAVLTRDGERLRLIVRGRDVDQEDKVVDFDSEAGEWTVVEDYEERDSTGTTKAQIIALLTANKFGMSPKAVAEKLGITEDAARHALRRMAKAGQIRKSQYGVYEMV